jgi:formylmethanofuran dehydrogenase subunit E
MHTLEQYIERASVAHGHTCAGQILGIRLAMTGLRALGINDPIRERKRIVTFVEIDRCATDAVQLVTGCRLGKRALKFKDFGKVAATFVDLKTDRALRVVAREESKQKAQELYPEMEREQGQQRAYRELPDEDLFRSQWVRVELPPEEMPGYKAPRVVCEECGEGINFKREVKRDARLLCRACAGERYYEPLAD